MARAAQRGEKDYVNITNVRVFSLEHKCVVEEKTARQVGGKMLKAALRAVYDVRARDALEVSSQHMVRI